MNHIFSPPRKNISRSRNHAVDRLYVRQSPCDRARGIVQMGAISMPCALGPGGITPSKREGDGATPAGSWPLRCVLFRPDRISLPPTPLSRLALRRDDGWCDDPADAHYNRPVRLPYGASTECMWRDDRLYDVVVVLGHNDRPAVPGRGSCIFFHLARPDYGATEGCVAVHPRDMRLILARCGPNTRMVIAP
jgi:L,D-peptidoglycan transpeptidase YkuD (ErfK/YbiS/YcfS/YnhG family)